MSFAIASASSRVRARPDCGTSAPISSIACLKRSRSSASRMECSLAPIRLDVALLEHAPLGQGEREVEGGLAADRRQERVRPLPRR